MEDLAKYISDKKWHGKDRYECPKCRFDETDVQNFREHLDGHKLKLIPVPVVMSLKINNTEAS